MSGLRALLVCPGRGSYGRAQLGSLPAGDPIVAALDRVRARLGRPALSELDRAPAYAPDLHVAGEHASLLTFACTAVDLAAIARDRIDIVGATGNSLGFYSALYASGALDLDGPARLIETLGHYQAGNVIGAQLMYPVADDQWRRSPALAAAVDAALDHPGVHVSIRLGGTIVLGTDADGLAHARRALPAIERGGMRYPVQLPLHSAFHTPLMAPTAERARHDLADLALRSPSITLIGGDGTVHRPWASPAALRDYTLGPQLVEPFDFERAIATAVGELGPDVVVLPGPGDSLGSAVAQVLIAERWRGLSDRAGFLAMQASERPFDPTGEDPRPAGKAVGVPTPHDRASPIVLAMARPDQRARVVASAVTS